MDFNCYVIDLIAKLIVSKGQIRRIKTAYTDIGGRCLTISAKVRLS